MQNITQSIIFLFITPAIYTLIIYFDLKLVNFAGSKQQRISMLLSVVGSLIIFIMFVLIDQVYQPVDQSKIPSPSNFEAISLFIAIPFLVSATFMLLTRWFMKPNQALSFVVLLTMLGVFISVYYIFRLSQVRVLVIEASMSFFLGFLLDFMFSKKQIFEFNK